MNKQPTITHSEKTSANGMYYQRLNVKGTFKINDFSTKPMFGSHYIGVEFRHATDQQSTLVYVSDHVGNPPDIASALSSLKHWLPSQIKIIPGVFQAPIFGELSNQKATVKTFSTLSIISELSKQQINVRRIIDPTQKKYGQIIILLLAFSLLARKKVRFIPSTSPIWWAIQSGMLALVLLISEIMIVNHFIETNYFYATISVKVYNILWWLIPAYIIDCGTRTVIWQYIESKTGLIIPKSVQKFISILIYSLAIFGIIAFVFDKK